MFLKVFIIPFIYLYNLFVYLLSQFNVYRIYNHPSNYCLSIYIRKSKSIYLSFCYLYTFLFVLSYENLKYKKNQLFHIFYLYIHIFIYLLIYLFINLFIYSFMHLYMYVFIYLNIYFFIYLSTHIFLHLSIHLFIYLLKSI